MKKHDVSSIFGFKPFPCGDVPGSLEPVFPLGLEYLASSEDTSLRMVAQAAAGLKTVSLLWSFVHQDSEKSLVPNGAALYVNSQILAPPKAATRLR